MDSEELNNKIGKLIDEYMTGTAPSSYDELHERFSAVMGINTSYLVKYCGTVLAFTCPNYDEIALASIEMAKMLEKQIREELIAGIRDNMRKVKPLKDKLQELDEQCGG